MRTAFLIFPPTIAEEDYVTYFKLRRTQIRREGAEVLVVPQFAPIQTEASTSWSCVLAYNPAADPLELAATINLAAVYVFVPQGSYLDTEFAAKAKELGIQVNMLIEPDP